MKEQLQQKREEYMAGELTVDSTAADPVEQFKIWYGEYEEMQTADSNAMTLSTVSEDGQPHSRVVLLKGIDEGGFEFYTNYNSDKGKELSVNPKASLNFFWPQLERQIRIEGEVLRLPPDESEAYFKSRPYGSQIGAWVSPQSDEIPGREYLQERVEELQKKYPAEVPRPEHWGGYRLMPALFEFWQGRPSRLHDRIRYTLKEGGEWRKARLAP